MKFLKNLIKNKGIVTIVAGIICVVILIVAYSYRVNQAIHATNVPVAARRIEARTKIEKDMIKTVKVASSMLTSDVIQAPTLIEGKYVDYNTFIPEGSFFYTSALVDWEEMPDSAWSDIPAGSTIVSLSVNATTTYGNSIYPHDKIDLYYQTYDQGKLVVGKLIEGIEVLAVKDAKGKHIFKKSAEQTDAAALIFAVPEDDHILLRQAEELDGTLIPVPRNAAYNPVTSRASDYLVDLIKKQTFEVTQDRFGDKELNDNVDDINVGK